MLRKYERILPMKKTLYSLMLDDAVVREVDILAHRLGTNRSNLINRILAEYVDYVTPERRINDIFSAIEQMMLPSRELIPFFAPNSSSMSMKSSLEYKYRPTIKYEVELYHDHEKSLGQLAVIYRSQSAQLIEHMTEFFRLWKNIEDRNLTPVTGSHDYALYEGKFVRSLALPDGNVSAEKLAEDISEYIKLFDRLLKEYLYGRMDAHQLEAAYYAYMINAQLKL